MPEWTDVQVVEVGQVVVRQISLTLRHLPLRSDKVASCLIGETLWLVFGPNKLYHEHLLADFIPEFKQSNATLTAGMLFSFNGIEEQEIEVFGESKVLGPLSPEVLAIAKEELIKLVNQYLREQKGNAVD